MTDNLMDHIGEAETLVASLFPAHTLTDALQIWEDFAHRADIELLMGEQLNFLDNLPMPNEGEIFSIRFAMPNLFSRVARILDETNLTLLQKGVMYYAFCMRVIDNSELYLKARLTAHFHGVLHRKSKDFTAVDMLLDGILSNPSNDE